MRIVVNGNAWVEPAAQCVQLMTNQMTKKGKVKMAAVPITLYIQL